jgi:hypothetical protein
LRGEVIDDICPFDYLLDRAGIANVPFDHSQARPIHVPRKIPEATAREVVQDGDVGPGLGEQTIHEVAANKTSSTRNYDTLTWLMHARSIPPNGNLPSYRPVEITLSRRLLTHGTWL